MLLVQNLPDESDFILGGINFYRGILNKCNKTSDIHSILMWNDNEKFFVLSDLGQVGWNKSKISSSRCEIN